MRPVSAWAQSMLALTYSLGFLANVCSTQATVYHAARPTVLRRPLEMNARIMPPHCVPLAWCRTKTCPHAKSKVSVLSHAVFILGLSCLCHRLLGRFSFMAQSYLVFLVEGFGVQWKGQTLRLSLPLRTLLTSMSITFGIPCCSSYFTCRLAASSKYRLTKLTWRESRFLDILLLTCYVTRRGLTIPLDTLFGTIALGWGSLNKGTVASWFLMLLNLNSFLGVLLD